MSEIEKPRTVWVEVYADDIMSPNGDPIHDGVVLAVADKQTRPPGIYDEYFDNLQHVYTEFVAMQRLARHDPLPHLSPRHPLQSRCIAGEQIRYGQAR